MTEIMQIVNPTPRFIADLISNKKKEVFMIPANYKTTNNLPTIRSVELINIANLIDYIDSGQYVFFYLEDLEEESENEQKL